ncbi:Piso0_000790 [Millerozyma farinosa CBS 7064]|uniref:Piso0_000790 protein n=1 Tax=Pichia sorbitophila (strain ATCC MYA-4447 / BCRC 22081 / CBS 7064 / NBRC 10061 / NRRL Y-12695) TaxID=559304 RepID=G8YRI7_PICSO|nr:Piso0_000790 [Millerozyma farinosa CBS 7064]
MCCIMMRFSFDRSGRKNGSHQHAPCGTKINSLKNKQYILRKKNTRRERAKYKFRYSITMSPRENYDGDHGPMAGAENKENIGYAPSKSILKNENTVLMETAGSRINRRVSFNPEVTLHKIDFVSNYEGKRRETIGSIPSQREEDESSGSSGYSDDEIRRFEMHNIDSRVNDSLSMDQMEFPVGETRAFSGDDSHLSILNRTESDSIMQPHEGIHDDLDSNDEDEQENDVDEGDMDFTGNIGRHVTSNAYPLQYPVPDAMKAEIVTSTQEADSSRVESDGEETMDITKIFKPKTGENIKLNNGQFSGNDLHRSSHEHDIDEYNPNRIHSIEDLYNFREVPHVHDTTEATKGEHHEEETMDFTAVYAPNNTRPNENHVDMTSKGKSTTSLNENDGHISNQNEGENDDKDETTMDVTHVFHQVTVNSNEKNPTIGQEHHSNKAHYSEKESQIDEVTRNVTNLNMQSPVKNNELNVIHHDAIQQEIINNEQNVTENQSTMDITNMYGTITRPSIDIQTDQENLDSVTDNNTQDNVAENIQGKDKHAFDLTSSGNIAPMNDPSQVPMTSDSSESHKYKTKTDLLRSKDDSEDKEGNVFRDSVASNPYSNEDLDMTVNKNDEQSVDNNSSQKMLLTQEHGAIDYVHFKRKPEESLVQSNSKYPRILEHFETASTIKVPLADLSQDDDEINNRDSEAYSPVTLYDFLRDISIRFYDDLEIGTKQVDRISLSLTKINENEDWPFDDYVEAMNKIPLLELYDFSCKELSKNINEGKTMFEQFDDVTRENNPKLFREYYSAGPNEQLGMKSEFQLIKDFARQQSKEVWYSWRTQLVQNLFDQLGDKYDLLLQDKDILQDSLSTINELFDEITAKKNLLMQRLTSFESFESQCDSITDDDLESMQKELESCKEKYHYLKEVEMERQLRLEEISIKIQKNKELISTFNKDINEHEKIINDNRKYEKSEIEQLKTKYNMLQSITNLKYNSMKQNVISFTFYNTLNIKMDFSDISDLSKISYEIINETKSCFHYPQVIQNIIINLTKKIQATNIVDHYRQLKSNWPHFTKLDSNIYKLSLKLPISSTTVHDDVLHMECRYYSGKLDLKVALLISVGLANIAVYHDNVKLSIKSVRSKQEYSSAMLLKHLFKDCIANDLLDSKTAVVENM